MNSGSSLWTLCLLFNIFNIVLFSLNFTSWLRCVLLSCNWKIPHIKWKDALIISVICDYRRFLWQNDISVTSDTFTGRDERVQMFSGVPDVLASLWTWNIQSYKCSSDVTLLFLLWECYRSVTCSVFVTMKECCHCERVPEVNSNTGFIAHWFWFKPKFTPISGNPYLILQI